MEGQEGGGSEKERERKQGEREVREEGNMAGQDNEKCRDFSVKLV